ncbi:murein biosynthesis integral membrane protein MurJ [Streptomyces sp. TX20-6-3]|uniref:murein biosynthesis integral membrane protein MurJ n=1 Tax=Streptomyces sp. TX20-6-3 TaxID=3028705 RepID=UPI0029A91826|nr:murein biosynthesis integral membrane protein MurJ [Streptomyces sp. TX20-6-3]MDX2565186.1 murein biosynthesis integral membrane protein MurJ [Streptomyces sp. TX20-6-3]
MNETAAPAQSAGQADELADSAPAADTHTPAQSGRMVLGALVSRITGFLRTTVVVAALGTGLLGDAFSVANTLPNIVFMLVIGGALNSVFVPELVRAAQHPDGGAAFTDRLVTACLALLLAVSALAVVVAPWLVHLYAPTFTGDQFETTVTLAQYCLPQVFFYGVFTVLSQVLNAQERFAAMMWAPVANNLVVISVFGLYLSLSDRIGSMGEMAPWHVILLGAGSTVGIVAQALVLLPSLRRIGYRWRPRFDWRDTSLTQPLRAAGWAFLLIAVNQAAFWVITVLATGVSQRAVAEGVAAGTGLAAYNNSYQLWVVPQGILVFSLVTAALPSLTRAAQSGSYAGLTDILARTVRGFAGAVTLAATMFLVLGEQVAGLIYGYGIVTRFDVQVLGQILAGFSFGLPAFCVQYTLTRGFYALGDPRTPVLLAFLTCGANALLSAAAAYSLPARWATVGMALAHTLACLIGAAATVTTLRRRIKRSAALEHWPPGKTRLASRLGSLGQVGTHLRAGVACLPGAVVAAFTSACMRDQLGNGMTSDLVSVAAGSLLLVLSLVLLARPLGIPEAAAPLRSLLHRLPNLRTREPSHRPGSVRRRRGVHRRR